MRGVVLAGVLVAGGFFAARADAAGALRFWNLTAATVVGVYVAPVGTQQWSGNLCLSDPDHTVESDERIDMVGVTAGIYDVRVVDQNKRTCVFHHATLRASGAYALSISEAEMKACTIGAK
jgi:hypothetical protein